MKTFLYILAIAANPCNSLLPTSRRSCINRRSYLSAEPKSLPEVYPLSRRKALLIKEAQRLDPSVAKDGKGELPNAAM